MFRFLTRKLGERIKTEWEANRWISELFAFKMYHLIGAILIYGVAYDGAQSLNPIQEIRGYALAKDAVLAGTGAWLSIALILRAIRGLPVDRELYSNPLEWSKGATAGCILFTLISICLNAPLLNYPYPLIILVVAVVEIIAATSGIAIYLWIYWSAGQEEKQRCTESLKAEHQVWSTIFSCSTIWVGVFVGGVLLSAGIGGTVSTLRDRFPNVSQLVLDRVVLFHGIAGLYAAVGTILWMLRPLHRRLEQISRAMDLLAKDKLSKADV